MQLDYPTLDMQRRQHPAWRLLAADSAPLVASFLHRVFVVPNVRVMAQSNLVESLEDTLYGLREQLGARVFTKLAQYGLQLFEKLNFQLLIITPLQKIRIIEPFVASVGCLHNADGRDSRLRNLNVEEYREEKSRVEIAK